MQTPVAAASGDGSYLVGDARHQARKPTPFLRLLGNLLILAGVLMLLGIGGWYGYTTWSNQQFISQAVADKGLVVEPTLDASALASLESAPSPTATAIPTVSLAFKPLNTASSNTINAIPPPVRIQDDSPPVHVTIPSVKIDSKVVPVGWNMIPSGGGKGKSEWEVANFAVGHHAGSANPGEPGNVVMSGHVDYKGEVFKELHNVSKGDEVIVQTEKGQYMYVITDLVLVKEEGVSDAQKRANARYMDPTALPTLTMITCYPYGVDDYRFIAIAHPYQPETNLQSDFTLR